VAGSPEFLASITGRLKNAVVQRVIGLVVLVAVAGAFAAFKFVPGLNPNNSNANNATAATVYQHAPKHSVHVNGKVNANAANTASNANGANNANNVNNANVANNAPGVNAANASTAGNGRPVVQNVANNNKNKHHAVQAQNVSSEGNSSPVVTSVPQNGASAGSSQAHLDDHVTYQYNALGRRDPFQSLVDGQFVGADVGGDAPPDPGGIKVVGIVWGANDQFALVEDVRGNSFVLRKGDKVQNGVVEGLKRDGVIVNITADGQSQSVVIPLVRKGDQNAR
jgi:hypothetical protein